MGKYLGGVLIGCIFIFQGCSQQKDANSLALEYLEVSGAIIQMSVGIDQFVGSLPPDESEKIKHNFDIHELAKRIAPVYTSYFTADELDELVRFYKSKTGQKLKKKYYLLLQEETRIGGSYLQEKLAESKQSNR